MLKLQLLRVMLVSWLWMKASTSSLEGLWVLPASSSTQTSQYLLEDLYFQFSKQISNNTIINNLYVQGCFLSQYTFVIPNNDDSIEFVFKTSYLMKDNCSLTPIDYVKNRLLQIFTFTIKYQQLTLTHPSGKPVFQLQKRYNYSCVLCGVWQLTTQKLNKQQIIMQVNGSHSYFCNSAAILTYKISLNNATYPLLKVNKLGQFGVACDSESITYANAFNKAVFLQQPVNSSQLTLYDENGLYLMDLSKIRSVDFQQELAITSKPLGSTSTSINTNLRTNSNNDKNNSSNSNTINTSANVSTSSINNSTTNNNNKTPIPNSQTPIPNLPNNILNVQSLMNVSNQVKETPQTYTYYFDQNDTFSFTNFGLLSSSSFNPTPLINTTSTGSLIINPSLMINNTSGNNTLPRGNAPSIINTIPLINTPSIINTPLTTPNPPIVNGSPIASGSTTASSSTSQFSGSISEFSTTANDLSSLLSFTSMTFSSSDSSFSADISPFMQQSRWRILSILGVSLTSNSNANLLSNVYMLITSDKIVLYAVCNVYYTNYQLDNQNNPSLNRESGLLTNIQWKGTNNACSTSAVDQQFIKYLFVADTVKQKGNDLLFLYQKYSLIQFKPTS